MQSISWIFPYTVSSTCIKSAVPPVLTRFVAHETPEGTRTFPAGGGRGACAGSTALSWGRRSREPARTRQLSKKQRAGLSAAGVSPHNSITKALHCLTERQKYSPVGSEIPGRAEGLPDGCPTGCDPRSPKGVRMKITYPREVLGASHRGGIPDERLKYQLCLGEQKTNQKKVASRHKENNSDTHIIHLTRLSK